MAGFRASVRFCARTGTAVFAVSHGKVFLAPLSGRDPCPSTSSMPDFSRWPIKIARRQTRQSTSDQPLRRCRQSHTPTADRRFRVFDLLQLEPQLPASCLYSSLRLIGIRWSYKS